MSKLADRFREIPKHLQQVTSGQAEQARNTNLVEFLSGREDLVKVDNHGRYRLKDHDSLIIRGSFYWWNSRGIEGNAIDFMQVYYGMDFKTAVADLTNSSFSTDTKKRLESATNTVQVSKEFSLPTIQKDMRRTFAYLIKTRCIDKSIVQNLAKEKLMMQDERGNIVFPWITNNREVVGAELNGTLTDKRFKGVSEGSEYGYGYNISIGTPKRLCVFESAIDLLSFWNIYKGVQDVLLVSMAGLKEEVIEGFLKRYPSLTEIHLGVDNDIAGKTFIESVQTKIKASPMLPPNQCKDWNDYLKQKSQG
ncbi:DUF3991 and toprim domain-containing protein [Bacillus sp. ISL-55]|uniref:DUF3991 and toprim domain-containing protein n=1 Tax=Bacillus sp. ISL-55 TaxID=2819134 RepID=UPI001BED3B7E|nr:DUF3991 and toprim domain-containing protein [Bacillus sp. ISL-55]MBT2695425.1 DUF3991 and TOPRIM domain-containing protein [Bacillus sp. ISL-55]